MPQPITGFNSRIGTCPHGMPVGACPICNGSGGGMGSKAADNTRKPGEMSWSQCFAQGIMMKQAETRAELRQNSALYNVNLAEQLRQNISSFTNNIQKSILMLQNSLPPEGAKILNAINQIIIAPLLNILDKIPKIVQSIQNMAENIRNTLLQVGEKLTAFFGEMKNFVNKKISDFAKKATKKVFGFFFHAETDEDEKVQQSKNFLEVFSSKREN